MELLLIRHGATAGNLEKRYIGRTDEPLCPQGEAQAKKLTGLQADHVFVSPLLRTRQTAELAFPRQPQQIVADFAETDFGLLEGKTAAELSHVPAYRAWVDSGCLQPIPGGESVDAFKARCQTAFFARSCPSSPSIHRCLCGSRWRHHGNFGGLWSGRC